MSLQKQRVRSIALAHGKLNGENLRENKQLIVEEGDTKNKKVGVLSL